MLDSNTHYLNEYEINCVLLEQQWGLDLPNKQEAVMDLAVKLLTLDCNQELFNWVFCQYLDQGDDTFYNKLEELTASRSHLGITGIREIATTALDGACKSLFDTEFDVLFENRSNWCVLSEVFKRVMNNVNNNY